MKKRKWPRGESNRRLLTRNGKQTFNCEEAEEEERNWELHAGSKAWTLSGMRSSQIHGKISPKKFPMNRERERERTGGGWSS